ncbi:MAG TPA: hypothetical protein VEL11_04875 [Candidatus Bathyarchaeia archaeon]|nr:hypothetical protein [Candidatus Bathyarchaeia archaeon]
MIWKGTPYYVHIVWSEEIHVDLLLLIIEAAEGQFWYEPPPELRRDNSHGQSFHDANADLHSNIIFI